MPTPVSKSPQPHMPSYVLPVAVFLFGIVLAIAVTFHALIFFQERKGAEMDAQITTNEQETAGILTTDVQKYLDAKTAVKGIDPNRIAFSEVLGRLVNVLPLSVLVSSLAIDSQNKLTVNLVTADYPSVAAAVTAIRAEKLFASAFIPNASTATSPDRGTVVNFPIVVELDLNAANVDKAGGARRVPSTPATPLVSPSPAPAVTAPSTPLASPTVSPQ